MARRKKGGGASRRRCRRGCNRHHFFFEKKKWLSAGPLAAELRQCPYCIAEVPMGLHAAIHVASEEVPIPEDWAIERILFLFDRLRKHGTFLSEISIERKLEILVYLTRKVAPETAKALEVQLQAVRNFQKGSLG